MVTIIRRPARARQAADRPSPAKVQEPIPARTSAPPASCGGASVSPSTAKATSPETTGSSVDVTLTCVALMRASAAK